MFRDRCSSQRLIRMACLVLMLALATGSANADIKSGLVGYYPLDEGTGDVARDSSGNGHDGTLRNGVTWISPGYRGAGVNFDGVANTRIQIGTWNPAEGTGQLSLATWIRWSGGNNTYQGLVGKRNTWPDTTMFQFQVRPESGGTFRLETGTHAVVSPSNTLGPLVQTWAHVAAAFDGTTATLYLNGVQVASGAYAFYAAGEASVMGIGCVTGGGDGFSGNGEVFQGDMDEVCIYNRALSVDEISLVMAGIRGDLASNPRPEDKATDVPRDVVFTWDPMETAVTRDVYFGTTHDDVNDASRTDPRGVLVSEGQTAKTFDPVGLEYGRTYYWRVDEVNGAPDNALFKGDVWSFTAEPYGYPVKPVKATASSSMASTMGPEKTIDGSGLDAQDQHGVSASTMWTSKKGQSPIWIQYEFDAVYGLHEMWVWNSNQAPELVIGFGAKEVGIETSLDGTTWTVLANVPEFAQATGEPNYVHNTTVGFGGVQAKFVKLTIKTNWADGTKQAALSEVRFFYTPMKAFQPSPASGSTGVALDTVLNWRPGREAARHQVLLSTDSDAVAKGTVPAKTVTEHSLDLGPLGLEHGRTYYWKVNEVNDAAATQSWEGNIWTLATVGYAVVDDFERYDDACKRVFFTWVDGFGYSASSECGIPSSAGNATGSTVGNVNPPFAERGVVHGGKQSMPLGYDNTKNSKSEATRAFDMSQDWTASGIKSLSLWFYGKAGNSGQLYVLIDNTKVLYDGDAADIGRAVWQPWNINLTTLNAANLKAVKRLTVGVEGGGTGKLHIDDIRLYPKLPEYVTPVTPGAAGLIGRYDMENSVQDSSGSSHNGTLHGVPAVVDGPQGFGKALQFNPNVASGHYVHLGTWDPSAGTGQFSVSLWANWSGPNTGWQGLIAKRDTWAAADMRWQVEINNASGRLGFFSFDGAPAADAPVLPIGEWVHVAATFDGTLGRLYVGGQMTREEPLSLSPDTAAAMVLGACQGDGGNPFSGGLDEVRIYNRVLPAGEVAGLAGRTRPTHKPF